MKIKSFLTLALAIATTAAIAQKESKWGATPEDSVECVQNISVYKNPYFQNKQYKEAVVYWKKAIAVCPGARKSLYIDGIRMYKTFYKEAKGDDARRKEIVDTIMNLYDMRIKYFGQEGFVLGRKGADMLRYDKANPKAAYETLEKSHKLVGGKFEAGAVVAMYQSLYMMSKKGEAEKSQLLELYPTLSEINQMGMEKAKKESKKKGYKTAQENIDKLFLNIASCEDIIGLYQPKLDAGEADVEKLNGWLRVMNVRDCSEEDFYLKLAAKSLEIKPDAESAYSLAQGYSKKKRYGEAMPFYNQAIELTEDQAQKEKILIEKAKVQLVTGQYSGVRATANKALAINPNNGMAYLLIGDAYSSSSKSIGDNNCTKKAGYWAAYDTYAKAKSVDPSVASDAGKRMGNAKAQFPTKEDCFFHSLTDGSPYQVGGWIHVGTTVRVQ